MIRLNKWFWVILAMSLLPLFIYFIPGPFFIDNRFPSPSPSGPRSSVRVAVLLTSYCTRERYEAVYKARFAWWANNYSDVFIVDSCGEPGVLPASARTLSFQQAGPEKKKEPSEVERVSLVRAFDHFDFSAYDLVVKVTAKYIVPDVQARLAMACTPETEMVVQYRHKPWWQQCELFGMKPVMFRRWLSCPLVGMYLEAALYVTMLFVKKGARLEKIPIAQEWRLARSDGATLLVL